MAIYLLGFAISVALIAIAEKQKTKLFILLSVLALLIPCLISGLRAANVGTDTTVYLKPLTQAALSAKNLPEYLRTYWFYSWRNVYVKDYEIGFSLLVYIAAKFTGSMAAVQFAVGAMILVPIYIALCRNRKKLPIWLGMLFFYLFFFNSTLNMMRQWVAMAFLLLAFQFLTEKKWGLVVVFSLCALLFHMSAILVIVTYFIYFLLYVIRRSLFVHNNFRVTGKILAVGFITVVTLVAILNLDLVIKLMGIVGIDRFSNYLKGNQMRLLINQILIRLPIIALFIINWKHLRKFTPLGAFYMAMLLLDVVLAQLISVDVYSFRIGYFFTIYLLLGIPTLYASIPCPAKRTATTTLLVAYCLFYWYYTYVLQLRHETYPYAFLF